MTSKRLDWLAEMGKISRWGGASSIDASPGDIVEDANGNLSALHPEEQNALPLHGEPDDQAWLKTDQNGDVVRNDDGEPERGRQGERVETEEEGSSSPGDNSSPSDENKNSFEPTKNGDLPKRVRTTESPSDVDRGDSSTAPSTAGNTPASTTRGTQAKK